MATFADSLKTKGGEIPFDLLLYLVVVPHQLAIAAAGEVGPLQE